ncbi:hypothetical protein Ciccas_006221 [Cichlidogyrus casuarinus]|uniref:Uncharacterized protein n=1 Tax=Cichlidogyrus casuarinus TaxID=1844966 RepID=A0ABD2Q8U2_9PLAT
MFSDYIPGLIIYSPRHELLIGSNLFTLKSFSVKHLLLREGEPCDETQINELEHIWDFLSSYPFKDLSLVPELDVIIAMARKQILILSIQTGALRMATELEFRPVQVKPLQTQLFQEPQYLVLTKENVVILFRGVETLWMTRSKNEIVSIGTSLNVSSDMIKGLIPVLFKNRTMSLCYFGTCPFDEEQLRSELRNHRYQWMDDEQIKQKLEECTKKIEDQLAGKGNLLPEKSPISTLLSSVKIENDLEILMEGLANVKTNILLSHTIVTLCQGEMIFFLRTDHYFQVNFGEQKFIPKSGAQTLTANLFLDKGKQLTPPLLSAARKALYIKTRHQSTINENVIVFNECPISKSFFMDIKSLDNEERKSSQKSIRLTFKSNSYVALSNIFQALSQEDEAAKISFACASESFDVYLLTRPDLHLYRLQSDKCQGLLSIIEEIVERTKGSDLMIHNLKQPDTPLIENVEKQTLGIYAYLRFLVEIHLKQVFEIKKEIVAMRECSAKVFEEQKRFWKRVRKDSSHEVSESLEDLQKVLNQLQTGANRQGVLMESFLSNASEICGAILLLIKISLQWREGVSVLLNLEQYFQDLPLNSYEQLVLEMDEDQDVQLELKSVFLSRLDDCFSSVTSQQYGSNQIFDIEILLSKLVLLTKTLVRH